MNKTPLSAKTNRQIGGNAPSVYLPRIEKSAEILPERLDEILVSHVIDPTKLREDDFVAFFAAREAGLLDRIEQAMGKPRARGISEPVTEELAEYQDEEAEAAAGIFQKRWVAVTTRRGL